MNKLIKLPIIDRAAWLQEQWQIAAGKKALFVIDEVQKVENGAEVIKSHWDEKKRNKSSIEYFILGSTSLDLQKRDHWVD